MHINLCLTLFRHSTDNCIKRQTMSVQVDPPYLPRSQDDPYSDCVWARIEAPLVNQSAARIVATISLGTAEVVPRGFGGKVRVGLICAKLRLFAKGGEIPHEDRWPEHKVETTTPVQGTDVRRRRRARSSKSDAKVEASAASVKGEAKTEVGGSTEEEETAQRSFGFDEWTIRSGGSETSAYWEFRAKKPEEEVHLRNCSQTGRACRC
jgi:hypothetical protein